MTVMTSLNVSKLNDLNVLKLKVSKKQSKEKKPLNRERSDCSEKEKANQKY